MKTFFALLLLVSINFSTAASQTTIIPEKDTSAEEVKKFLRKNSKHVSVLDYWSRREIDSHIGLGPLVEDFELALRSKIPWKDLEARLLLAKKVSFGREHRHLLMDYFEKRLESVSASERKALILYACVENKIEAFESGVSCASRETSLLKLPVQTQDYPLAIVDGVEMSTQKLKHLSLPSLSLRFVFLSMDWLPYEFVGTPEDLLKQKIPLNPIVKAAGNLYQLTKFDQHLEDRGQVLLANGELTRLAKFGSEPDSNWWTNNKKWAGPTLLILAAALVYSQKDKTFIIQTP